MEMLGMNCDSKLDEVFGSLATATISSLDSRPLATSRYGDPTAVKAHQPVSQPASQQAEQSKASRRR